MRYHTRVSFREPAVANALRTFLTIPLVWRAKWRDRKVQRCGITSLAAVAIFRQEAPFLNEWLEFHRAMGVSHFYLYNNFSTDDFRAVLRPWVESGVVTLYEWPVKTGQLAAYWHCVRRHAMHHRWLAFFDIDEFLFSPTGKSVVEVLEPYGDLPGLFVDSPFFGAAGHAERPAAPTTRAFTRRAPLTRTSVKTIANPRWIYAMRNVHAFKFLRGEALNTARGPLEPRKVRLDLLRLNHYWSRSLADLGDKIARGDASTPHPRDPTWHLDFERSLNEEEDLSIIHILDRIAKSESSPTRTPETTKEPLRPRAERRR